MDNSGRGALSLALAPLAEAPLAEAPLTSAWVPRHSE